VSNDGRFFIGQQSLDVPSTTAVSFNGVIDELEVFKYGPLANRHR